MAKWPQEISIEAFRKTWTLEGEPFWQSVFQIHKDKMQIKNPKVAAVNLEKFLLRLSSLLIVRAFRQ